MVFYIKLLTQKKEPRDWDWDNHIKLLQDAMCEVLDFKDNKIRKAVVVKEDVAFNQGREGARVCISVYRTGM